MAHLYGDKHTFNHNLMKKRDITYKMFNYLGQKYQLKI